MLMATFDGCSIAVGPDKEMTVETEDGPFCGRVSVFNIERVSPTKIQTNVTLVRASAWGKVRNLFSGRTVQGFIEHR
jgi:hypothetical protein